MRSHQVLFTGWLFAFYILVLLPSTPANASEDRIFLDSKPFGYVKLAALWPRPSHIDVCWEETPSNQGGERGQVQSAIAATWERYSSVRFFGWGKCLPSQSGIRIAVDDVPAHTEGLGLEIDELRNGMTLNFSFKKWNKSCASNPILRAICIRSIAVHEFGHALGLAHEHMRTDRDAACDKPAGGEKGDTTLTPYDPDSVMNYCNPSYNNYGSLSYNDVLTIRKVYP